MTAGSCRWTRSSLSTRSPYLDRLAAAQLARGCATPRSGARDGLGAARRARRHGLRVHGRLDGRRGRREGHPAAEAASTSASRWSSSRASGGARMQEGTLALMQLAKTVAALERLRMRGSRHLDHDGPDDRRRVRVVRGAGRHQPRRAQRADRLRGARVAAGTIGQELPPGFQRAEFLFRHGFVDRVVARRTFAPSGPLLRYVGPVRGGGGRGWEPPGPRPPPRGRARKKTPAPPVDAKTTSWSARPARPERAAAAYPRLPGRWPPFELHGDRITATTQLVAGFATLGGHRVASSGIRMARTPTRTSGATSACPTPRLSQGDPERGLAERSGLPIVTFVDVPVRSPVRSEERGSPRRSRAPSGHDPPACPGRAPSSRARRSGARSRSRWATRLALENAIYPSFPPEGCASILWRTPARRRPPSWRK